MGRFITMGEEEPVRLCALSAVAEIASCAIASAGGDGLPKSLGDVPAKGLKEGTASGAETGIGAEERDCAERGGCSGATCVRLNTGTA